MTSFASIVAVVLGFGCGGGFDGGDDEPPFDAGTDGDAGSDADSDSDTDPGVCDADGDGFVDAYPACDGDDCVDTDPTVHPGAADAAGDAIDQDCDGLDGVDADGDGHASLPSGGDDCDDADEAVSPESRGDWLAETIGAIAIPENVPSTAIAVDGSGAVHVVYDDDGDLTHATKVDAVWEVERIDSATSLSWEVSGDEVAMARGSDDSLHVVYCGEDGHDVRYAASRGGAWTTETIARRGALTGCHLSIALDEADLPRFTYADFSGGEDLWFFVTGEPGAWTSEEIGRCDCPPIEGSNPASLAFGPGNSAHVALRAPGEVLHLVLVDGVWTTDSFEDGGSEEPTIAVDDLGIVHLAFEDSYVTNASGAWVSTEFGDVITDDAVRIALDASNAVHLAYRIWGLAEENGVGYATNASGAWVARFVEGRSDAEGGDRLGYHPSLALDSDGEPHIASVDWDLEEVRYLRHAPDDGVDWDCDGVD